MTTHSFKDVGDNTSQNYPVHDLGEDFFVMTTIEEAKEYVFRGVHRHDFYEVLWFTDVKPNQLHYIDFNTCLIANSQLFLLQPGQVHCMDPASKQGFLMAISKDFFENMIGNHMMRFLVHSKNFSVIIPDCKLKVFNALLELIRIEYDNERRSGILESYLKSWFLHCIELQKEASQFPNGDSRLQLLIESIETNFRKQRGADFYARQLSVSAKRLNELSRESFGKTISQLINDRLILEAKREMGFVEKPIKEISYELGFSEPSYFTRFFGKQTGYAPKDFRKRFVALEN